MHQAEYETANATNDHVQMITSETTFIIYYNGAQSNNV